MHIQGWRMVPRKTWVAWKILAGSWNLGSVFDKSWSLVFAWFVFTFFESRNFLPKSLGLGFLTRISASRRVSDFTIRHPYIRTQLHLPCIGIPNKKGGNYVKGQNRTTTCNKKPSKNSTWHFSTSLVSNCMITACHINSGWLENNLCMFSKHRKHNHRCYKQRNSEG